MSLENGIIFLNIKEQLIMRLYFQEKKLNGVSKMDKHTRTAADGGEDKLAQVVMLVMIIPLKSQLKI